jgi:hypothetical protein
VAAILIVAVLAVDDLPEPARAVQAGGDETQAFELEEDKLRSAWGRLAADRRAGRTKREEYLARMARTIERDLFRPNPELYPPQGGGRDVRVNVKPGQEQADGWLGRLRRWLGQEQKNRQDHLARVAAVRAQARALSLQSTMLGTTPTALINGEVLKEGDQINDFSIKSITSGACVVAKDGVEVVLRMNMKRSPD